ncbi:MAG TPA: M56 family metallopeptidase [Fimbriimonadaceae bacterium]|nr:M56 family metallopeptidase [Fimbriimonadaceae bacterium]
MTLDFVAAGVHATALAALVYAVTRLVQNLRPSTRAGMWWLVSAEFALGWFFLVPVHSALPEPEHLAVLPSPTESAMAAGSYGTAMVAHAATAWTAYALGAVWSIGFLVRVWIGMHSTFRLWKIGRAGREAGEVQQRMIRRLAAELGLKRLPRALCTTELSSPAIFGLFDPVVFLPSSFSELSEGDQRLALIHELAHIRRQDSLFAIVPELACAVFWFLPIAHWVRNEWVVQRELACDGEVLERTHCNPEAYGQLLLRIVESQRTAPPSPALGVVSDFRSLKRRLSALSVGANRHRSGFATVLAVAALAVPVAGRPPTGSAGVLADAGFEAGSAKPEAWSTGAEINGVAYLWDRSVSHSGGSSISITKSVNRYFPIAQWSQTFARTGSLPAVEFSGWVKAENAGKGVLDVQFRNADGVVFAHHWVAYFGALRFDDPGATFGWKLVGGVATIPEGTAYVSVALQDYGPGQIWLDDAGAWFTDADQTDPTNGLGGPRS